MNSSWSRRQPSEKEGKITADGSGIDHIKRESTNAKRHTLNITMDYDWKIC